MEVLQAKKRNILGKKVKSLRYEGDIPAVVYGKNIESTPLRFDLNDFTKVYDESGESSIIVLHIEGESPKKVLIAGVQKDPCTEAIIHADLRQVNLKEKITAEVSINFVGEPSIVKSGQGITLPLINEVEITCLPTDLPAAITVDITNLTKVGDTLHIKDLPLDRKKIEVAAAPEEPILKIDYPEMAEEEEEKGIPEEEAIAEVKVTEEKEKEEEEPEKTEGRKQKVDKSSIP